MLDVRKVQFPGLVVRERWCVYLLGENRLAP